MQIRQFLLVVAAAVIAASSWFKHRAGNEFTRTGKRLDPNEWMLLERSYPDAVFAAGSYRRAVTDAWRYGITRNERLDQEWEVEGPGNIGGRFNCIAIDKTNASVMYAGAATGGIFKTENGGTSWSPVFDDQPFLSIGSITIDPSDNQVIWAGTGDANISGYCYVGDGIYRSDDGGITWENKGLGLQYIISKIIVHPTNSNIVYAATMGLPFDRDDNRGLYKTTDGGTSWEQVLFTSDDSGVIDLVMNNDNPGVLYAATFNRIRNNNEILATGDECAIWKTTDGGISWEQLTVGLPGGPLGRIGLAMYQDASDTLYAVIGDTDYYVEGVYYTVNGGEQWEAMNTTDLDPAVYSGFGWYFGKIFVNPVNPQQVYLPGVNTYSTSDFGETWDMITPPWWQYIVHADSHDIQFMDGDSFVLCTDGGLYRTDDNGITWMDIDNIPVNQVYHAIADPFEENKFWCGVQDNGTSVGNDILINDWLRVYGGDGFQPWVDPGDPDVLYVETQYGGLAASVNGGVDFFDFTGGINPEDRVNWDMPYILSSGDPGRMYCGTDKVYRVTNAPLGTWVPISGDLTDGLDENHSSVHTITCLSESQLNFQKLYAGTADANVWRSLNAGTSWTNITSGLPERFVTSIVASPNSENTVYVSHSGYRDNEYIPHVHRSDDNGSTWTDISGDLPQVAVNDLCAVEGFENTLFAATDNGVYYTQDGGQSWERLGTNMPMMPVFDVALNIDQTVLVASTFARSVQTMDVSDLFAVQTNETYSESGLRMYPNPAPTTLYIDNCRPGSTWRMYDSKGEMKVRGVFEQGTHSINTSIFPEGVYLLVIDSAKGQEVFKFVR